VNDLPAYFEVSKTFQSFLGKALRVKVIFGPMGKEVTGGFIIGTLKKTFTVVE